MSRAPSVHAVIYLAFALALGPLAASAQAAVEAWVQRFSQRIDSTDRAQCVVTDSDGNVIVAGYSDDGNTGRDYLIVKYSGAGVPLWTNRYNGPQNSTDEPKAVAVHRSGKVFVTGYSDGNTGFNLDYATVAYSGTGAPLWTNRYNGPQNGRDYANAIAVDDNGNVFVTGYSFGSGSSLFDADYATVAYSDAGMPLWTNRYNGPGKSIDEATAVAVDGSGNVFVTGWSPGIDSEADYATVAYSGTGVPLWTNRYDGPVNYDDVASAVAVDAAGNVFVTGYSARTNDHIKYFDRDYATVAYSGAGVPLWTNRYSGSGKDDDFANTVAVDGSGIVFVTGFSYSSEGFRDYATVAYSGAGVPLWTNSYNGPGNSTDEAYAMAVDSGGNVFVTGRSSSGTSYDYATVAYSGAGAPLWTNRFNGPANGNDETHAVAVDGSGNVFVTGQSWSGSSDDYATVAYSGAGVPLWTNSYNGQGIASAYANAVAVDGSGNVFVTGYAYGSDGTRDYVTVAYSDAGTPLWTNRYNGPANSDDLASTVVVDVTGNVFVTGNSYGSGSSSDFATVAYSSAGVPLWTNRYNGPGNSTDLANAIAVDGNGNVFVAGHSTGNGSSHDYATIAYSGGGVALWTNRYNGPGNNWDQPNALAVDASGNVFVTGLSTGSGTSYDYATVAYSGAGAALWTNRYNGPGNGNEYANAVAVSAGGDVFVTGSSLGANSYYNFATVAYSGAGAPLWTNRYQGPYYDDTAAAVAVGRNGNVFVAGASYALDGYRDYATVAYSGAGVPLWTNRYQGPGKEEDRALAVAVDGGGNVIVTGSSAGNDSSADYATVAYSGAGVPLWTNRYNGPANGHDVPLTKSCLAIGPDGAVYVTGASDGNSSAVITYDYATIKYSSSVPLPIRLNHQVVGNQLVLDWTNAAFRLQSAPAVQGDYADIPGATSPHSTSFSGAQRFFRLNAN